MILNSGMAAEAVAAGLDRPTPPMDAQSHRYG